MFRLRPPKLDITKFTNKKSVKTPASALTKTSRYKYLRTRWDYISKAATQGGF